jgi:alpha-tubulin suppressor-like RCC1 family protein
VSAGHMTSFAVTKLGDVMAWGCNKFGALAHEDALLEKDVPLPRPIEGTQR